ncbi:MAG: dihydroorotate dehydrogenase [Candidatus Tokpelaia sp. JSC085]|nr:MAG: dihydroorotate dehydrogenase [Candidatus Tokpelaia sp. JSC085]
MKNFLWHAVRRLLFAMEPEKAHNLVICALNYGILGVRQQVTNKVLRLSVASIDFPNPLGMAAGFDKDAKISDAILKLGFGFVEIGTITPLPQKGNVQPRMFRLPQDQAIINRMGFNNAGYDVACKRLAAHRGDGRIIGINIGTNKDSSNRIADYVRGIEYCYHVSNYFALNVSSPNTLGLRSLQERDNLRLLLDEIFLVRDRKMDETGRFCPIFLKIAPDFTEKELDDIATEVLSSKLDGLIVANTTVLRTTGLAKKHKHAHESGGLSGVPLFQLSTTVLAKMRKRLGRKYPLIGVGGITNTETALEKIRAGADLLQLYSGLIYHGPNIAKDILEGFISTCYRDGVNNIAEYRDQHLEKWANKSMEL